MDTSLIMHINYCEQGQTFPDLCRKAVDWGFDGIEFRSKNLFAEEPIESYLDRIAKAVQAAGLREVVFGYPSANMLFRDPDVRKAEVGKGLRFYRLAKERFPLKVCNAFATVCIDNPDKRISYYSAESHGSFIAPPEVWDWAVEGYKIIGDAVAEMGLRLAFETHMRYLHDSPESSRKLADLIGKPAIGVNLDYGNIVYMQNPLPLADTIRLLADKLYYVHWKNSSALKTRSRADTALADGDINHREYLRLLIEHGYRGPICVEAPRPGDREWFARQDCAYVRSLLADARNG